MDRAPLRTETGDGRVLELEMSLHQRRRAGKPLAVQCLVCTDVTQQKQLPNTASPCNWSSVRSWAKNISAGNRDQARTRGRFVHLAGMGCRREVGRLNVEENRTRDSTPPGVFRVREQKTLIQESMGITLAPGGSLPVGRAWRRRPPGVGVRSLSVLITSPRVQAAIRTRMVSGLGSPGSGRQSCACGA